MKSRILIINGHPYKQSFNTALVEAYKKGALNAGAEVQEICIADLHFDPNLKYGYHKKMDLEPDLIESWDKIYWANHIVWVHPVWWGGLPAISKGFIDRVFLPGKAFQYRDNSVWWDKLLVGKTGHIITTLDQPKWYYWFGFGRPSVNQLKKSTLEFCGITPVRVTYVCIVKNFELKHRQKWIQKIETCGMKLK